jgi:SOS response associated peptidase (SRAP)
MLAALPYGKVTPYRAAKVAARRSRPGREQWLRSLPRGVRGGGTARPTTVRHIGGWPSKLAAREHRGAQRDRDELPTHSLSVILPPDLFLLPSLICPGRLSSGGPSTGILRPCSLRRTASPEHRRRLTLASLAAIATSMCNLYSLTPKEDDVGRFFRVSHNRRAAFKPVNAIFPRHLAPVVRQSEDGEREIILMNWGFLRLEKGRAPKPVTNVRDDQIKTNPFWRDSFQKRRCLVPASSFCDGDVKSATWHWFALRGEVERPLFAFPASGGATRGR